MSAAGKKPSALDPKLLGDVKEAQEGGEMTPELREAIEEMVQEKLKGGRERAGHRSKTMSVKLEPEAYKRLSRARFETEKSGQEIFVEALNMWFKRHNF